MKTAHRNKNGSWFLKLLIGLLAALCVFVQTVLGIYHAQRDAAFRWRVPEQGQYERTLRIAALEDYGPYSYLDENGNPAGFDVELAYAIGEKLGANVEIQLGQWDKIKAETEKGVYDLLMGVTLSDTRRETLELSVAVVQDAFETFGYEPEKRPNPEQNNIAVIRGGYESELDVLEDFVHGISEEDILPFDSYAEELDAVAAGECAYAVVPGRYGEHYVNLNQLYGIAPQGLSVYTSAFCIGTAKGNTALIEEVNAAITELDSEGRMEEMRTHWFEQNLAELTLSRFLSMHMTTLIVFLLLCLTLALAVLALVQWRNALNADEKLRSQAGTLQEITDELRSLSMERDRVLYQDSLTGCLNFEGFKREVLRLIREHPGWEYILWYSDFKGFKYVNELLGREEGNKLLCYQAQICRENMEEGECFGRISDDRFVAFTRMREDQVPRFEEGAKLIRNYFRNRGTDYDLQYIVGVYSLTPEDFRNPDVDKMVANARVAQKTLKESTLSVPWMMFNPGQYAASRRNMMLSAHLKQAIQNGEIQIYVQPQVNCVTKCITGAEALCRWKHPEFGWVSPGEFIPLFESTGQIHELDRFVWEEVCKLLKKWNEAGRHIAVSISVNVSRMDLRADGKIADHFQKLVREYGLTPDQLRIEITESAYMNDADKLIEMSESLRSAGFIIEMDDFGSGYSSLNMLKEVPVDVIKLDLRFLKESGDQRKGQNILSYIIRMAKSMGLGVITEGVETQQQEKMLRSLGCSEMQGYLFFRPMPVEQFEALMLEGDVRFEMPEREKPEKLDIRELMDRDSLSYYLFNYCIGGASVDAYDGERLELILTNEQVFDNLGGDQAQETRRAEDIFQTLDVPSRERLKEALDLAVETGYSSCVVQAGKSGDWLRATYRYLYKNSDQHILFALQENLSEVQAVLETMQD